MAVGILPLHVARIGELVIGRGDAVSNPAIIVSEESTLHQHFRRRQTLFVGRSGIMGASE